MNKIVVPLAAILALSACGGGDSKASSTVTVTVTASAPAAGGQPAAPESTVAGEPSDTETLPALDRWEAADGKASWTCGDPVTNAVFTFTTPNDDNHAMIKKIESLRKRIGGAQVYYLLVNIDATKATDDSGVGGMSWATKDARSVDGETASGTVATWMEELNTDSEANQKLYNEAVDLHNELIETMPNKGAKGYDVVISKEPITSMVSPKIGFGTECIRD